MVRRQQAADRAIRPAMRSPGHPKFHREVEVAFWDEIAKGLLPEEAAAAVGVSQPVGGRWFRHGGGMRPFDPKPPTGRYLSFREREEIALLKVQGKGVREIARTVGRNPGTIWRELRRNAATRSGKVEYRASVARARLEETITILRGMWTRDVFDFHGRYYTLTGNRNEPKPVQQPGPPLLIGGWGNRTLRLVAEQADIWSISGPPHNMLDYITERSAALDDHCAAIDRAPRTITRSVQYIVSYDDPAADRKTITELIAAGVTHIVLSLRSPYPPQAARWLADQIITPVRSATGEF